MVLYENGDGLTSFYGTVLPAPNEREKQFFKIIVRTGTSVVDTESGYGIGCFFSSLDPG
jgi:hypothetical protein